MTKLKFNATKAEKVAHLASKGPKTKKKELGKNLKNSQPSDTLPSDNDGYPLYRREVFDSLSRTKKDRMLNLRKKVVESWQSLPKDRKEKYNESARSRRENCAFCDSDEVEGSFDEINWVMCDTCDKWYHNKCVDIDVFYSESVAPYVCPNCHQDFHEGLPNLIALFRSKNIDYLHSIENPFLIWSQMGNDDKAIFRNNIIPVLTKDLPCIGELQILSERGIINKHNNCWTNSAFHIICGSMLSKLLPSRESCQTDVCKSLLKIRNELQSCNEASTPLKFTTDMKVIVRKFRNRDQRVAKSHDDAASFVEEILTHLIDNSIDEIDKNFICKTLTVSVCRACGKSDFNVQGQVVLLIPISQDCIPNISVQSLLWDYATKRNIFNTFSCECPTNQLQLETRTYFLTLPVALLLLIERGSNDQTVIHTPVTVNEKLNLKNLLPGKFSGDSGPYRLAAALSHHGKTINCGHYSCTIFDGYGQGIKFDDSKQIPVLTNRFLQRRECKENCRLLVYINDNALQQEVSKSTLPWEASLNLLSIDHLEDVFLGLMPVPNANLPLESLKSIIGNGNIHADVIHAFLRYLAFSVVDKCHVELLPTQFISAILQKRETGHTLSNSIQRKDMIFTADIVLIPFHHEIAKNGHWSIIAMFPKEKIITHCDSAGNARSKEQALSAINLYLCKALTFAHKTEEINQWQFLELSEVGLQQQDDDYSCGVFTCINGYNLLTNSDITVFPECLAAIRYWIGVGSLEGACYVEDHGSKTAALWSSIESAKTKISLVDKKSLDHSLRPFEMLQQFLSKRRDEKHTKLVCDWDSDGSSCLSAGELRKAFFKSKAKNPTYKTYQDALEDSSEDDTDSDSEFVQSNQTEGFFASSAFVDEFIEYVKNGIASYLDYFSHACDNDIALSNDELSERLSALMILSRRVYHGLANGEFVYKLRETFGQSIISIKKKVHEILIKRKEATDDFAITGQINEYVHEISRLFGHSRADFIDNFLVPEQLTYFLMKKYKITYENATGRLYSTDGPTNTVYFEALKRVQGQC